MQTETTTNKIMQLGNMVISHGTFTNPQRGRVYSIEGVAPALNGIADRGGGEPKVLIKKVKNESNNTDR